MKLSELQERILTELEKQPAETQKTLATRTGTHQPSISRSIRPLVDTGLVVRDDEGRYKLAPTGRTLLQARHHAERVGTQVGGLAGTAIFEHIQEISKQFDRQIAQLQRGLVGFDALQKQVQQLAKSVYSPAETISRLAVTQKQIELQLAQSVSSRVAQIVEQSIPSPIDQLKFITTAHWAEINKSIQASNAIVDLVQSAVPATRADLLQQQIRSLTQGFDDGIRRLTANLTVVNAVSRTFDQLDVFKDLREAIREEEAAAEAFRNAGWPIALSTPKPVIRRVVVLHEEGKTGYATQTIMGYYRRDNHKHLVAAVEKWRDHPLFAPRMHIIDDALEAHREGQYTLSVPALILQLEGVMNEYVVVGGLPARLGKIKEVYEAVVGNPMDYSFATWAIAETLLHQLQTNTYISTDFKEELARPTHRRHATRHTIYHGIMPAYDRESTSLRVFLLLDALSALPQLASIKEDNS